MEFSLSPIPGGSKAHSLHSKVANIFLKGREAANKKGKKKELLAYLPHQTSHSTVGKSPEFRGRDSLTQFRTQNPQRILGLVYLATYE